MAHSTQPPYGKRLLTAQVDHIAKTTPDKVYASYAKSPNFSQGFRDITYKELANAVNRSARWLEKALGGKSDSFETVAYIGDADIRYFIFILASHKAGYKLLLLSPRNSLEGQINLIDKTECRTFLRSARVSIDEILNERSLETFVIPDLDELLDPASVPHIPYEPTFEQAHADPYVVYHSSGSTGLPKPIISPHDAACTVDALNSVPPLDGRESIHPYYAKLCPRFFSSLPFFHAAGVVFGLCMPVYFGNTVVFGHPSRPTNAGVVDDIIDHANVDSVWLLPSILEEMTKTESSMEHISRLKMVIVGAGPLSTQAGTIASQKSFLAIVAGSTEAKLWVTHVPDPEDWQYFMIGEDANGIEMRLDPEQNLYEMVYVRRPDCDHLQAIFKTFRHLEEYATGDLFAPHPTKPHLWRSMGRRDNLIVLSNAEKVQPDPIQDTLIGHKAVREALVVGQGKFQLGVILELMQYPDNDEEARKLMDDIWPMVEEANRHSPSYGRLLRSFVTFASANKPFVRVGKGSLSKPATLALYADEIEALFAQGESGLAIDIGTLDISSDSMLQKSVQLACEKVFRQKLQSLDVDFFSIGVDSLAAMILAATLKKALKAVALPQADKIGSWIIYKNPSVRQLSSTIMALANSSDDCSLNTETNADRVITCLVERVILNAGLETQNGSKATNGSLTSGGTAVLLTGSTGSLGSYILNQLLSDETISKIYCLNRAEDGESKQRASSRERNLLTDFRNATFVQGDLSKKDFGLDPGQYQAMLRQVRYIIHAQWPVNFNVGITSFEPHVQGVANLASFVQHSPTHPPLCFLSSIASVRNWADKHGQTMTTTEVPEQSLPDNTLASSGYGLSKLAASTVLDRASKQGVRSLTLRIGQIAGPSEPKMKGVWPKHEWLPSLIASSKFLGVVPESLEGAETVDWIPVDRVARIVCELAKAAAAGAPTDESGYAHIVSPQATTWKATVLPAIQEHFHNDKMQVVPLTDWVARLRESAVTVKPEDLPRNPAIKLLDFYDGLARGVRLPRLATDRARAMSQTMRECEPVGRDDVERWLGVWDF